MIKAVLLDLDNTLLHNPDREWVAAFRQQWDRHFDTCYGIENASSALRNAIDGLNSEAPAYNTNAATILDALAVEMSLERERISASIASFYQESYRSLQSVTSPVILAAELVETLLAQNLLVAIATNPLFPESATRERIAWAGLGEFLTEFAFITNSENMHFAKPSPAYFAETVARVGVEPDETLVIGDSKRNDIDPARAIGIHTWQVNASDGLRPIHKRVREASWEQDFLPQPPQPGALSPQLKGNIAALYGLLAEVKPNQWRQRPDPDEWSIMQILCHLWQSEESVHRARLQTILHHADPFIAAPPPPGPDIPPCHENGYEVLYCFQQEREVTIDLLSSLKPMQWGRPARHSIFGLTDLLEMAHFTAQHDRLHITQLCQTLGKCAE
ncbi:MAG: HAD-IA family hydrolase [Chloroflexi bacterium]|nr:HAD-IA family hydrolase [Chloroflexota bacterium]